MRLVYTLVGVLSLEKKQNMFHDQFIKLVNELLIMILQLEKIFKELKIIKRFSRLI